MSRARSDGTGLWLGPLLRRVRWLPVRQREDICAVDRNDLPGLVHSLTERSVIINRRRLMAQCPAIDGLVITDAVSEVKSPYPHASVSPIWITQSLIAVLA